MAVFVVVWIGFVAIAGFGVAWIILSRFPEVFFHTHDWRLSRRARIIRRLLFAGGLLSAGAAIMGIVALLLRPH